MDKFNEPISINWDSVAKWRDELRSGKYLQGKGKLRLGDKYCCLGVFCEAIAKIIPIPDLLEGHFKYDGHQGMLSTATANLLGNNVLVLPYIFDTAFNDLNDALDYSFDEIADLLHLAILEHQAGVPDSELIK